MHNLSLHREVTKTCLGHWSWKGVGYCSGHFGELVQGKFTLQDGSHIRGLITLPCRNIGTTSNSSVIPGNGEILIDRSKQKVRNAVEAYKYFHNVKNDLDIAVSLDSSIQIGIGMGSSTADIVSTIRSLDHAFGNQTNICDISRLTLMAEMACDSTMFDNSVKIFSQRNGTVVEDFRTPFMPFYIHGFVLSPGEEFNTDLTPPAEYSLSEIEHFDNLRDKLRLALKHGRLDQIADIATQSAIINQRHFPKPNFEDLLRIAEQIGAMGVCVSHSGTIAGLIFSNDRISDPSHEAEIAQIARSCGMNPLGFFRI